MKDHKNFVNRCGFDYFFTRERELNGIPEKNSTFSTKIRKDANQLYSSKKHDDKIHKQILLLYTKSIAFAPNDSEELALGYSNRSALLKHLHKYKESIFDIESALKLTITQQLREKLECRKKDCLNLIKDFTQNSEASSKAPFETILENALSKLLTECFYNSTSETNAKKLELPELIPSKNILCFADSTSLEYDEYFGRQVSATRDLKSGKIVAAEKSYINYPLKSNIYLVCSHCLKLAWNAIPCNICTCTVYCTEKCKDKAWEEYHETECNILPFLCCKAYEEVELTKIILTTRLFIKAVKKEGLKKVISNAKKIDKNKDKFMKNTYFNDPRCHEKFCFIYSLIDYSQYTIFEDNDDEFFCSMVCHLLNRCTDIFDKSTSTAEEELVKKILIKLKNILDANGYYFEVSERCFCRDMESCFGKCNKFLGLTFTPACCFFNHSCIPNTARIFINGGQIILFTIRPVKKGEQLCISYGPSITISKVERYNYLDNNFYFKCQCQACIENWPIRSSLTTFQDLLMQRSDLVADIRKFCSEENINLNSICSLNIDSISEKSLQNHIKIIDFIYEKYKDYEADALSLKSKFQIEHAFGKLYGVTCSVPYNC